MTERKPIIVHTKTGGTQYGSTSQYRQIHQPGSIQQGYVPRSPIVSSPMRSPMKSPFKRATDGVSAFLKSPRKSPMFRAFSPQISKHSIQQLNQTIHGNKDLTLNDDDLNIDYTTKDMLEDGEDDGLISIWQAGFSVVNLFLGLCLLSYPYAFYQGGLLSLIPFGFICLALCYTGKLIVRAFIKLPENDRDYPSVGKQAFGNFGYSLISFGILAEMLGALMTNSIFLWNNIGYLFPNVSTHYIVIGCSLLTLPTCWMLNFSQLTINSFLGCVCKIFTAIVVIGLFFYNINDIKNTDVDIKPANNGSLTSIAICIGIFIMSFAGHPCLPSVYASMRNPEKFEKMLNWSFFVMLISYICIGLFGYFQFGSKTVVIITGNINAFATQENRLFITIIDKMLIVLVILGCYFQVSPILSVFAEIPETWLHLHETTLTPEHEKKRVFKLRLFRTFVFLLVTLLSYGCVNILPFVEAITGSVCTMITSVIAPALFYFLLFQTELIQSNKLSCFNHIIIILFLYIIIGIILSIALFYQEITNVFK